MEMAATVSEHITLELAGITDFVPKAIPVFGHLFSISLTRLDFLYHIGFIYERLMEDVVHTG